MQVTNNKLVNPSSDLVDFWQRHYLQEALNALHAHMQVYEGNPGGWDNHSSFAALQRIVDDLTAYTLTNVRGVNVLNVTHRSKVLAKLMTDYLVLSDSNLLIKSGYATGDTAKYATLLTGMLRAFGEVLRHQAPEAPYEAWRKQQRR